MFSSRPTAPVAEKVSFKKRAMLLFSVIYNYILGREHHHVIIENEVDRDQNKLGNVYLGAMPMKKVGGRNTNHHLPIIDKARASDRPLKLAMATVQNYELQHESTYFLMPVKPKEWKDDHEVNFHKVEIPDFSINVEYEKLLVAVKMISMTRQAGHSVFIHCKAGRSRSVLVLLCYLMTEYKDPNTGKPLNFEQAYTEIKSRRSYISFNKEHKREAVTAFVNNYLAQKAEEEECIRKAMSSRSAAITIPGASQTTKSSLVQKGQNAQLQRRAAVISFSDSLVNFFGRRHSPLPEARLREDNLPSLHH